MLKQNSNSSKNLFKPNSTIANVDFDGKKSEIEILVIAFVSIIALIWQHFTAIILNIFVLN